MLARLALRLWKLFLTTFHINSVEFHLTPVSSARPREGRYTFQRRVDAVSYGFPLRFIYLDIYDYEVDAMLARSERGRLVPADNLGVVSTPKSSVELYTDRA